jgi:hypothetical protein
LTKQRQATRRRLTPLSPPDARARTPRRRSCTARRRRRGTSSSSRACSSCCRATATTSAFAPHHLSPHLPSLLFLPPFSRPKLFLTFRTLTPPFSLHPRDARQAKHLQELHPRGRRQRRRDCPPRLQGAVRARRRHPQEQRGEAQRKCPSFPKNILYFSLFSTRFAHSLTHSLAAAAAALLLSYSGPGALPVRGPAHRHPGHPLRARQDRARHRHRVGPPAAGAAGRGAVRGHASCVPPRAHQHHRRRRRLQEQ